MDFKDSRNFRLLMLVGFLGAVLLVYLGVMYDTQVTNHDYYSAQSIRTIAREEKVEASRGIITDRSGQAMVSNRSTYNLTFDSRLLRPGDNESEAILRLVQLCRDQGVPWADTLPISQSAPFIYRLDGLSERYMNRFLTYLMDLKEVRTALGAYLLDHPDLLGPQDPEEDEKDDLTDEQQGAKLVKQLTAEDLSTRLLHEAGITPVVLLDIMRRDLGIPEDFTMEETRLVAGVQYELTVRKLINTTAYVLAEDIDTRFISLISDGSYAGAKITSASVREYETTRAAHILGYVTDIFRDRDDLEELKAKGYKLDDKIGRTGVEAAFEDYLRGTDGWRVVSTNSDGKVTGEFWSKEPVPGNTVELTLDLNLQNAVEDSLHETISRINAKEHLSAAGGAAVVKVGTGEVLALASYPTYDLATYNQNYAALANDPSYPLMNRATQGRYPPGSTLKPLTSIAALQEGVIGINDRIHCPRHWTYPGSSYGLNCWYYGDHGMLNVTDAITVSCNYFFAQMGYLLGMDRLAGYMADFGFGSPTGIEIGDNAGTLPKNNEGEDNAPWAAIGQHNQLVTPLQLANYIATLVSGGKHYETHLLKAVKTYDNSAVLAVGNSKPINTIDLKPENVEAVKKGMHGLTKGSLAPYFRSCIVEAGAKTGTAQLGGGKHNNGVFVCFAPYDDPEIAVAIAIEKGGAGSALASTAVSILNAYFSADASENAVSGENQLLP